MVVVRRGDGKPTAEDGKLTAEELIAGVAVVLCLFLPLVPAILVILTVAMVDLLGTTAYSCHMRRDTLRQPMRTRLPR